MNDPEKTGAYQPGDQELSGVDLAAELPHHIGRYRIGKVLGEGGFGIVYLAHDDQLNRPVAIKVPHRHRVSNFEIARAYLIEARTVANLDHPHIVPVYDIGSTEDYPCFIVSKFIEGRTLAQKIRYNRPTFGETAELVATIAEALQYAHRQGLVHRDIKPSNILIDNNGEAFVVDFGLALKEQNLGHGPRYAGTLAYMSPEQARGEGHRVDGRSDIFSLGVVFYEMLVGRLPFRADSPSDLREQVTSFEARPPRQFDENIPKELERICLKALSKRSSDRYTTAVDMAGDLRHFLTEQPRPGTLGYASPLPVVPPPSTVGGPGAVVSPTTQTSNSQPTKIVPKGLRSFDAHDADFFLELLPGPRDRDGLPDSLRFWKNRIEEKDADATFLVGLIYGPSGCGKSSLVKAGLLPHLSDNVSAVYVEATAAGIEARLLNGLRKRFPALVDNRGVKEALAALRRGEGIPAGKKVLIVLDQFEQWLHAKKEEENTELVQALRQCDGGRLQCIVMVRDDFWMAATRFMRDLEVRLVEAQNSGTVDLFDTDHATKVLAAFGRAFGKLPENPGNTSRDQKEFLNQAVSGLAQEGKVICVRLALFAEMMKGKAWTLASLKAVGGTEGVGVTFLEETFSAATAPPEHRYHQKAARASLKTLLPETGSDIKGHMRSSAELMEASGYGGRPKDFDDLIRILDSEIRLITPTDPEGKERDEGSTSHVQPGQKYYQLTHDYLVVSLREWLTRKQKETRRGRAELLLADLARAWTARPEKRQLPSLAQWLVIRWLTRKKDWGPSQRKLMQKAGRYHARRGLVVLVILSLVTWATCMEYGALKAHALRDRLLDANTNEVTTIIRDMAPYRRWLDPRLREAYIQAEAGKDARKQLHLSLALLPVDPSQGDYLYQRLLDADPHEVPAICDALTPYKEVFLDRLWAVLEAPPNKGKEPRRLRAASALARYDPDDQKWEKVDGPVVDQLVAENAVVLGLWINNLRAIKRHLLTQLIIIYKNISRYESERIQAAGICADYAADQPQVLANLVMDADEKQFGIIYPKLQENAERALPVLLSELDRNLPGDATEQEKEQLAKRQSNAAVALLRMDHPERAWRLLKHAPDPRARSYLIHRLSPLGAGPKAIINHLDAESDLSICRAMVLSLGEFKEKELSPNERNQVLAKLQNMYSTSTDPGLHASAEWLLREWKQGDWLKQANDDWANDRELREKRLADVRHWRTSHKDKLPPQWYVNGQGQTMVVIPGAVEFVMGSPATEADRQELERQHTRQIERTFAIAAKPVTVEQYRQFNPNYKPSDKYTRTVNLPAVGINWHMATAYCNWLSKSEGISDDQWCYEALGQTTKVKENYLSLTGYRLPTEAEMEYATRAGTATSRYYGETDELLAKYAWYFKNSKEQTWPVGTLKPNDLGLFDAHGNVFNWCQNGYEEYPINNRNKIILDNPGAIVSNDKYMLRGGSFTAISSFIRSSYRDSNISTISFHIYGFRPARTVNP